jgi:hypothetical protein
MIDSDTPDTGDKKEWQAPVLTELDLGLENVENGFLPGNDGGGGLTTSLS